jgi:hypothetical protein
MTEQEKREINGLLAERLDGWKYKIVDGKKVWLNENGIMARLPDYTVNWHLAVKKFLGMDTWKHFIFEISKKHCVISIDLGADDVEIIANKWGNTEGEAATSAIAAYLKGVEK